ncbi:MAG: hypothetical protein EOP05_22975, partial [Proteobacteria bacterium]
MHFSSGDLIKFGASFTIMLCLFLAQKIFVRFKQKRITKTKEALKATLLRSLELNDKSGPSPILHSNNDDRDVDFFFYFTNEVDARRASKKLEAWGFHPV